MSSHDKRGGDTRCDARVAGAQLENWAAQSGISQSIPIPGDGYGRQRALCPPEPLFACGLRQESMDLEAPCTTSIVRMLPLPAYQATHVSAHIREQTHPASHLCQLVRACCGAAPLLHPQAAIKGTSDKVGGLAGAVGGCARGHQGCQLRHQGIHTE
jgi:hypothetical protein